MPYQPSVQGRRNMRQGYGITNVDDPVTPQDRDQTGQSGAYTFRQRQEQGLPRPAPPGSQYNPSPPPPSGGQEVGDVGLPPPTTGSGGPHTDPGGGPNYGQNIQDLLHNNVFNYQPFNPGTYQTPQFNPYMGQGRGYNGANQHQTSMENIFGYGNTPGQQQMNFGGYNPGRVGQAQEQSVYDSLINPSAYTSDVAMDTFNRLRGGVDESFGVEKQKIGEEMARRGLDASSIHGGRLGDATIQHDRTLADLAGQIATQQAQTYGADRERSLNAALGYRGQGFNEALGGFDANLRGQGQAADIGLRGHAEARATNSQNFNQGIGQQGFNNDVRSQNLNNLLASLGFQQQGQAQGFNQSLQVNQTNQGNQQQNIANLLGYGQQQFDNQMSTNQFNQQQQNDQFQQWLQAMGMFG